MLPDTGEIAEARCIFKKMDTIRVDQHPQIAATRQADVIIMKACSGLRVGGVDSPYIDTVAFSLH
jgi:hypothetical protein